MITMIQVCLLQLIGAADDDDDDDDGGGGKLLTLAVGQFRGKLMVRQVVKTDVGASRGTSFRGKIYNNN